MSRTTRRHAVGHSPGSIADDLLLAREQGGFAEAVQAHLAGTLLVLGLDHPTDSEVDHARRALRELVSWALAQVVDEHPVREPDATETRPGTRVRQAWQAVAAVSLTAILLPASGRRGRVVDTRVGTAGAFDLSLGTVKRYEDKLIDTVLAPRIFERLGGAGIEHPRRSARAPEGRDHQPMHDPLWGELGASEADLADALLRRARIPGEGFDAQEFDMNEPSRASTGMVTYSLAMTRSVSDAVIAELYKEILGWITSGGVLPRRHGSTMQSTWTESQCLLALTARPYLVDGHPGPIRLADSLIRQQRDGGWNYRDDGTAAPHPVWCFYPLLALNRATRAGWISGLRYRSAARRAAEFASTMLEDELSLPDRLMTLAVLHLATSGTESHEWTVARRRHSEALASQVTASDAHALEHTSITDDRQPLWHARINPALLYLHARRVLGPSHEFTRALINRLLSEFDPLHQGWTNSHVRDAKPFTWTTALALRSAQLIRADVRGGALAWPLEGLNDLTPLADAG